MSAQPAGRRALLAVGLALAMLSVVACGKPAPSPTSSLASPVVPAAGGVSALQRTESSGSVEFSVTPEKALAPGETGLAFGVAMNTHSVDLDGFDLKALAVLRDGQGREFAPAAWQAPAGGHHRSGILRFSASPLIQADAMYVELVVRDVAGTRERVFHWDLGAQGG